MQIKLILPLLLIASSCGKIVSISNKKLESVSQITQAEVEKSQESATLLRASSATDSDRISIGTIVYVISPHSSHNALTFIKSKPESANVKVKATGKKVGKTIYLETIVDDK